MKNSKRLLTVVIASCVMLPFGFSQEKKKESNEYLFSNQIVLKATSIKNQENTGTCWSYCTTSFIESELIRMGKPAIDLSEMYNVRVNYQDKAMNYVLRQGRAQFGQGGLSHDVMSSIRSYGLVPEFAYPGNQYDTARHNHSEMAAILQSTVETVVTNPNKKLSTSWEIGYNGLLDAYMGEVPETFEYKGKSYNPLSFADYLGINPDDYVTFTSFTNAPFYAPYILQVPDNWANGSFYNLPLNEMMEVIDDALANGFTIAWDADVSERTWSRKLGIAIMPEVPYAQMTTEMKAKMFKEILPEMEATQEARQAMYMNYQTTDDHLMHIVGTAFDQNGNSYYLVKNSWGDHRANEGYVYVSKTYMAMKTIGIMIHKDGIQKSIAKKIQL